MHHKAYLNSFGNGLDFVSVICYWVDFGLMLYGYPYISIFKAMAATRPLRLLSVLPGTAVILKSLETGWDLMLDVSGFLFFFMFLFAMLGLISFRGVFSRQCYFFPDGSDQGKSTALVEPPMYCSGYYNGTTIVGPFDITIQANTYPGYQGLICPHGQQCIADPSNNPNNGYMNYDMIFSALLNVYTFVSMELWTDMMYLTQDADSRLAALFYCIGVYIIGFILIYLLLAVITSAFARVRATSGSSSAFTKNRSSSSFTSLRHQHILQVLHPGEEDEESVRARNNTTEPSSSWAHVPQQPQKRNLNNHSTARSTLNQWKRWIVRWVQSKTFFYFGGGLVLLDTLFMCLRSVYASESMLDFLDNVETAMTFIFAIEIVIRMMGALNWLQFWSSFKNKFDLFLVIITCVIQLPVIQDHPAYMYLTIFQVLRMYRLFLCIPRLEKLLNAALGTGESVINVIIFLLWSTALFAPIFMQLFGGDFVGFMEPNDDRLRFDTFWQSFLALIMLYTSETWTGTLYDAMQSQSHGGAVYAGIAMCLYFAFARYIVAGLYIAVILENFELDDEYIRKYQFKHFIRERLAHQKEETATPYYQTIFRFLFGKTVDKQKLLSSTSSSASIQISRLPSNLTASLSKEDMRQLLLLTEQEQKSKKIDEVAVPKEQENSKSKRTTWMPKKISRFVGNVLFPDMENVHISKFDGADQGEEDYDMIVAEENRQARQFAKERSRPVKSLFLFSETNRIRRFCKRLVGSCRDGQAERQNGFNWFIMACVLVSILVVILDEPSTRKLELQQQKHLGNNLQQLVQQQTKTQIYEMIDFVMGIVFVVEMLLRVIADGLILPRRAYLRHAWNRLDFVVILLNFGTLFSNNDQLPRALGTVRSMRVLRLIRYFGGVRDVFIDLFHAFPLMMDAMLLTFLVMIPFSVYGVNIFGGRFYTCNDTEDPNVMTLGRAACVNEFVLNVGADDDYNLPILVPRTWQNPVMNLYSYDDFGVALRHVFSMTSTEGWVDSMFFAMSTPPENDMLPVFDWDSPMIYHSIFYVAFMIISHGTVQLFVGVIIEKFKQRSGITTLTFAQRQYVDLQRQLAELKPTMKVFRPSSRIRAWCYDLIGDRHSLFNKSMTIIVILNMGNVDALQTLYHTIGMAMPSIIRVSAVFMLVMCLFAMIFMEFFGLTKYGQAGSNNSNFRNYGNALLLLVRMTTGEGWNEVMMDYTYSAPNCVASSNYLDDDCGSANWAYFLFNFFYITCTHIFLNLFIAVIIANFEYTYETRSRFTLITKNDLRKFKHAWAEIDPEGTGFIKKEQVAKFFKHLTGRFQVSIYDQVFSIRQLQKLSRMEMDITSLTTNSRQHQSLHQRIPSYDSTSTKFAEKDNIVNDNYYNYHQVNRRLAQMDTVELEQRRKYYNLLYMEIVDAETSKGIAFSDVLHIMAFRFVDIERALTLHPLMDRLEKLDEFNKKYAAEKARGVFLTLIQRKRYLRQLWQKRNQQELEHMALMNDVPASPIPTHRFSSPGILLFIKKKNRLIDNLYWLL
ncbi:Ion transport protein-domain-containing protein [Halteromyces radiatus]|uniref:Ion transport protein-domain-containing protein n=1 Tax=Halteromyces radiatus TaxID=101107 RepID=UPI00221F15A8|nr:Ion transport protein-domain-containing protein [Halteromyces radiatus]KAI8093916.1 Ion transport protein-domain-containing protein [Halteromyces radiatus]